MQVWKKFRTVFKVFELYPGFCRTRPIRLDRILLLDGFAKAARHRCNPCAWPIEIEWFCERRSWGGAGGSVKVVGFGWAPLGIQSRCGAGFATCPGFWSWRPA